MPLYSCHVILNWLIKLVPIRSSIFSSAQDSEWVMKYSRRGIKSNNYAHCVRETARCNYCDSIQSIVQISQLWYFNGTIHIIFSIEIKRRVTLERRLNVITGEYNCTIRNRNATNCVQFCFYYYRNNIRQIIHPLIHIHSHSLSLNSKKWHN